MKTFANLLSIAASTCVIAFIGVTVVTCTSFVVHMSDSLPPPSVETRR